MTPQEQYNQVATYGGALKDPNDIRKIAQRAFELNLKRLGQTGNFEQNAATYQAKVGDILSGGNSEGMAPEVRALAQQAVDEYKQGIIPRTPDTGPGSQYLRGGQEPITPPQQAQQWNITPGQAPTPITPTGMPSLEQPQGPQTAQQWNITPGQSPTPIKPPTGVNEPGSIGDSGQNKPQQQAQGGKLLRPSEFTNLQKQGLTENDIIRLGGDIYLKPNSRFTIGGTGEGIAPVQTTSAPSTQGTPPAQSQAQQQQSVFQISPDYKASDYSSITGQAPITPPQSSVDAAQKAYEEALGYKPLSAEETEAQKRRDELDAQARAIAASRDLGLVSTEGQAVAMPFITGQQAQIQKQAAAQIGAISAQEIPLEQKLARLQASREAQRQASLDISKSRLEAEKSKATAATSASQFAKEQAFKEKELGLKEKELGMKYQPETEKPVTLGEGQQLIDPKTGRVIASGAKKPVDHSAIYKEWQDAVNSGYKKGFIQYQDEDANRKAKASGSGAISDLNQQLKLLQIQQAQQQLNMGTVTQGVTSGYAERVQQSNQIFNQLEKNITKYSPAGYALQKALPNWSPGKDPNIQSQDQAERNFVNAVLRRESGAAISPTEFTNAQKQYFPQPGDSAQVLQQKKSNRNLVEQNLIKSSGPAFTPVQSNDPLGIR